jgi:hypothetical protein
MSGISRKNSSNPYDDSLAQKYMKIINPPTPPFRKGGLRGDLSGIFLQKDSGQARMTFSGQILYPATTKSEMSAL